MSYCTYITQVYFLFNHMINTLENNAITNKLLLRYKNKIKGAMCCLQNRLSSGAVEATFHWSGHIREIAKGSSKFSIHHR